MITLISPAKTLDCTTHSGVNISSNPYFLDQANALAQCASQLSCAQIKVLMGVSDAIATLNHQRYAAWQQESFSKQAIFLFKGDVYTGLDSYSLSEQDCIFAQKSLVILSGLYGYLRPCDMIKPYRLEMGLKFSYQEHINLYSFWGDAIAKLLEKKLENHSASTIINLASQEYFRVVKPHLQSGVITPVFKEKREDVYKTISFVAKKARGRMSRYIIDHQLQNPEDIKQFNLDGYTYRPDMSNTTNWIFAR